MKIYIDEAGRGPLAGPLYVGLVIPINIKKDDRMLSEFKDSKILTEKKRDILYQQIIDLKNKGYILFSSGWSNNNTIDKYGITKSINYAILKGINAILGGYRKKSLIGARSILSQLGKLYKVDGLFIDGKHDFGLSKDLGCTVQTMIKADRDNVFVSMASIVAKVERDELMKKMAKKYPLYGFEKHKGYGTKFHIEQIKKHGPSDIHRYLFLRKMNIKKPT